MIDSKEIKYTAAFNRPSSISIIDAFRRAQANMTDEQRLKLWSEIQKDYCIHCGSKRLTIHTCIVALHQDKEPIMIKNGFNTIFGENAVENADMKFACLGTFRDGNLEIDNFSFNGITKEAALVIKGMIEKELNDKRKIADYWTANRFLPKLENKHEHP